MTISKQKSLHGRKAYISSEDALVSRGSFATGGEDKPSVYVPGSHDRVAVFDDFLGDTLDDNRWAYTEADTGNSGTVIAGTNGVCRILSTNTAATKTAAGAAAALAGAAQWKPNQAGPEREHSLRLSARVKLESVGRTASRIHAFVGFTDNGAEFPVYDTGAGMISAAADAMGFVFAPGGDTGWSAVSAKSTAGDSGDQLVVTGKVPVANKYTTLEMEYRAGPSDTGGRVHFWIDGLDVGSINSPVNSATALTPYIGQWVQDTGSDYTDIDYVAISAPRDTGL